MSLRDNRFISYGDRRHWSADFGRFAVGRWCKVEERCPGTGHPFELTVWLRPPRPER